MLLDKESEKKNPYQFIKEHDKVSSGKVKMSMMWKESC